MAKREDAEGVADNAGGGTGAEEEGAKGLAAQTVAQGNAKGVESCHVERKVEGLLV